MVQRLQLYVFRQCIQSILLTLFVILAAIMLVDVVEQFRTVGNDTDINAIQAVQLSAVSQVTMSIDRQLIHKLRKMLAWNAKMRSSMRQDYCLAN